MLCRRPIALELKLDNWRNTTFTIRALQNSVLKHGFAAPRSEEFFAPNVEAETGNDRRLARWGALVAALMGFLAGGFFGVALEPLEGL